MHQTIKMILDLFSSIHHITIVFADGLANTWFTFILLLQVNAVHRYLN